MASPKENGKVEMVKLPIEVHETNRITGDIIGNTAYSEGYVLNVLMKLVKIDEVEELEEFIENDLCTVWDMTAEKDVAKFLLSHNVIEIIFEILSKNDNPRLTEVVIGISANMCCYEDVIREFSKNNDINNTILLHLTCEDSLVVIQVLRFIFSNVYYDKNFDQWLQNFVENNVCPAFEFILLNSTNEDVLINSFETVNCICSGYSENCDKDKFISLFVQTDFVRSTIVGFEELMKCFVTPTSDQNTIERCDVIFLALHSVLVGFSSKSVETYSSELKKLLITIDTIINKNFNNINTLIDVIEYTTSIVSGLGCPAIEESIDIFKTIQKLWVTYTATQNVSVSEFENEDSVDITELTNALPQYFVRMIHALPTDKVKSLMGTMDTNHLLRLSKTIDDLIQAEKMDDYFKNISGIVKELS